MSTQHLEHTDHPEHADQPESPHGLLAAGRHPLGIGHLVMGVAFAGLVVIWALVVGGVVDGEDVRWLLPGPWVLAGVAGLVGLVVRDRRAVDRAIMER